MGNKQEYGAIEYAELETILADWHPAIAKAIAEGWDMSQELVNALETQLDPLDASEYPLLQRLCIANHNERAVTLDEHSDAIDEIRQGLRG